MLTDDLSPAAGAMARVLMLFSVPSLLSAPLRAAEPLPEVRRVVTLTGDDGGAVVLADGPGENTLTLAGTRITRLWETGRLPVSLDIDTDAGRDAGNAYRPDHVGTSLYTADIPPGIGVEQIPMHAQDSLDYIAVLEGRIELLLPGRAVMLERGDVLIQAGNVHSWRNDGVRPARLLVVVLTGRRD